MRSQKSREVAWTGMLFALAIALSFLESAITPLLGLMPAMKLGLSNLVVMYALLFLNTRTAAELVLLKALFALLTRGPTAGSLSPVRRRAVLPCIVVAAAPARLAGRVHLHGQRCAGP